MKWLAAGFERNENAEVLLIWECSECGCEVFGGMKSPSISCPECKAKPEEDK